MRWPALLLLAACSDGKVTLGDDSAPPDDDACADLPDGVTCDGATALTCADGRQADRVDCDGEGVACFDGAGCARCAPSLVDPLFGGATLHLPLGAPADEASFGHARFGMRPVTLTTDAPAGTVVLEAEGPVTVWDPTGARLALPARLAVDDLPAELLVEVTGAGAGRLVARYGDGAASDCAGEASLAVVAVPPTTLPGRVRDDGAGFAWETVFETAAPPAFAAPPARLPDRSGAPFDVYVVAHRDPSAWAADPSLVDLTASVETATFGGATAADAAVAAMDGAVPLDGRYTRFDVVFDFDRDGALSPGDLYDGPGREAPGFTLVGDLAALGAHAVEQADWSGGRWLGQRAYWPADIASLGAVPLVVVSHGNGHQFTWYDYLGQHLASHGYVVMAHENNTGPGIETASGTTLSNTDWLLANLDTVADGALAGHVDGTRIAWIGHSRGGEGVVRAWHRLAAGEYTVEHFAPEHVRVVSSIAPTVFNTVTDLQLDGTPYHQLDGTADGDVTGQVGCDECQFFRIAQAQTGEVSWQYVQGADHNDFNCCGFEDGAGLPALIGREEAQVVARAYVLALADAWLGEEPAARDYFTRAAGVFRPGAIDAATVITNVYRPGAGTTVLDDFQDGDDDPERSSAGTTVVTDMDDPVEGKLEDDDGSPVYRTSDPFNQLTQAADRNDEARGLVFGWSGSEQAWTVELPEGARDLTGYRFLALWAGQVNGHPSTLTLNGPVRLGVRLEDGAGGRGELLIEGPVPQGYPRNGTTQRGADELQLLRARLDEIALAGTVDLADVRRVSVLAGEYWEAPIGRIVLDEVSLWP